MKRLSRILVCVSLLLIVAVHAEELRADWNKDVLRLFLLEERDEALQKLLREARYPEKPAYTEDAAGKVKEVVLCPQPSGRPLLAIFARSEDDAEDVSPRSGHLIVIRNDGLILPFYHGANSLDGYLQDLNGDGIMDCLKSWELGYKEGLLTGLHLVPITEKFAPALVLYWKKDDFEWRVNQPDLRRNPTVQIGTWREGVFETVAEYKWSADNKRWLGANGSLKAKFLRLDGNPDKAAKELLKPKAEQDGAGQPATRPESKSEGGDKPQPEAEGRSR